MSRKRPVSSRATIVRARPAGSQGTAQALVRTEGVPSMRGQCPFRICVQNSFFSWLALDSPFQLYYYC